MSAVQGFMTVLKSIWDGFFSLTSPFFDLTFKQIFLGLFVVLISARILFPLLGIGSSVIDNTVNIARSGHRRFERLNRSSGGNKRS